MSSGPPRKRLKQSLLSFGAPASAKPGVFGEAYIVDDVPYDGDCLFSSLAIAVSKTTKSCTAHDVRNDVIQYITEHKDEMENIPLEETSRSEGQPSVQNENYLNRMATQGQWGDGVMLASACRLYKRPIHVVLVNKRPVVVSTPECAATSPIYLGFASSHYVHLTPRNTTTVEAGEAVDDTKNLHDDDVADEPTHLPAAVSEMVTQFVRDEHVDVGRILRKGQTLQLDDADRGNCGVDSPSSLEHTVTVSTDGTTACCNTMEDSGKVLTGDSIAVSSEPCHINDVDNLPVHTSAGRTRKFYPEWYKQFPWLHWEGKRLLCHTCSSLSNVKGMVWSRKSEDVFIRDGYSCNWKKAVQNFKEHAKSSIHVECCGKMALIKGRTNVSTLLEKQINEDQMSARRALHTVITTLLTLAHTGCAVRGHDNDDGNLMTWLNLRAQDVPVLKSFLLKRTSFLSGDIQNELLSLMANDVLRQILIEVKNSAFFGVIMDETTDISTKEQVSICFRYLVDDLTPAEALVGLYEVTSTSGENLCKVLLDVLHRCDLPLQSLRAQCFDGASNMAGAYRGVQSRLKEMQPLAVYVHCYAHSLNLVLQEAAREVPIFRDSLEYLHRAAILLGRSAKRKAILKSFSAEIKPLCPTRWSVKAEAISTALQHYEGIIEALNEVADDSSNSSSHVEARSLLDHFDKSEMYFCLVVAKAVIEPVDRLSRLLQGVQMTANGGLEAVKATHLLITSLRSDTSFENFIQVTARATSQFALVELSKPRTRKPPKRYDSGSAPCDLTVLEYFRQQYFMLIDTMSACLERRFINNADLQAYVLAEELVLKGLATVTGGSGHHEEWLIQQCQNVAAVFRDIDPVGLAANMSQFRVYLAADTVAQQIFNSSPTSISEYITYLRSKSKPFLALFPQLVKLLQLLLVIPATSATAERSFSCLRRVKTWLRSSMTQARLNSTVLLHSHRHLMPNLESVIDDFVNLNDLRRRIFGNVHKV